MIEQMVAELYQVVNKYPQHRAEMIAALKGVTSSEEYLMAISMYESTAAMSLKTMLGGQDH